jgi:hypothetical protein
MDAEGKFVRRALSFDSKIPNLKYDAPGTQAMLAKNRGQPSQKRC